MPYKDPRVQNEQQKIKWRLWREMRDGNAMHGICRYCHLDVYALDPERHSNWANRWYHFCDPKSLGIRPLGKNEPVYDLVRRCDVALKHRYLPEGGLDPRTGAEDDLRDLLYDRLVELTPREVATPRPDSLHQ